MPKGKDKQELLQRLRDILGGNQYEILKGLVKKSDETAATIDVLIDDDLILTGVKLRSVENGLKGITEIPADNSIVIIAKVFGSNDFVYVRGAKLKKVIIDVPDIKMNADTQIVINCKDITVNGGVNKGIPKVEPLVQRMNELEKAFNELQGEYNVHSHASHGTPTPNTSKSSISLTTIQQIENTSFKH